MKTICAWCGSTIKITCHCGAPLSVTNYVGSTFDTDAMVCFNGESVLTYSRRAIESMEKTYGLCQSCAHIPENERAAMIKARRAIDATIPGDTDLARILEEIEQANRHERETRRASRAHNPDAYMEQGTTRRAALSPPDARIAREALEKKGSQEGAEKRNTTRGERHRKDAR